MIKIVPKSNILRCAIYGRVSDDEAANREHGSLEQQEHIGRALAEHMSATTGVLYKVSHLLIEDKAISGGTTKRPKYQELLQLIRQQKIDVVIAKEVSRVNRSVKDFCEFMQLCQDNKVAVHIKNLDIDPNQPMGKAMFQMLAVVAELEREMIRERTRSSIRSAMKNNSKISGGVIVLGFDRHADKKGVWIPNKSELVHVRLAMETFAETLSYKETLHVLAKHGVVNKGGKPFKHQSLRGLLTNRKYIGKLTVPSETESLEVDLPFGAVVPVDLFWRVQKVVAQVEQTLKCKNRSGKSRVYPLTGLLSYEDGTLFKGTSGHGRGGSSHYYYRNVENNLTLNAPAIEQAVIEALRIFEKDERLLEVAANLKQDTVSRVEIVQQQKALLSSQLNELNCKEQSYLTALTDAVANERASTVNALDRQLRQIESDRDKLRTSIALLDEQAIELSKNVVTPKDLKHSLKALFDNLNDAEDAVKRGIFRQLFKNIVVYRKNQVKVTWAVPSVNESGKVFVSGMKWLLRTDLNRRPSD